MLSILQNAVRSYATFIEYHYALFRTKILNEQLFQKEDNQDVLYRIKMGKFKNFQMLPDIDNTVLYQYTYLSFTIQI